MTEPRSGAGMKLARLLLAVLAAGAAHASPIGRCAPASAGEPVHAVFHCADGKTVDAWFDNRCPARVALRLSDGRVRLLPQALSASGARYADADEQFVFWNKGRTAFIDEQGRITYRDCRTPR